MTAIRNLKRRPWLASSLAIVALALVAVAVPVTYERTAGQEVTVTLTAPALDQAVVKQIATGFREALNAGGARISMEEGEQARCELSLRTEGRSRRDVEKAAIAYASTLAPSGIGVSVAVRPFTEQTVGNLYAVASQRVCELTIDRQKSDAEIEADIRSQLASCGATDADVHVTRDGDMTQVSINCSGEGCCPAGQGECQIKLNVQGGDESEAIHPVIIQGTAGQTPEQLKAEIEAKLREQGITDAEVVVEGSGDQIKVKVERRK